MAADDKTEKATPRKRKEARREGRMPRSPDIGAWLSLLVIAMLLPHSMRSATNLFRRLMTESTAGFQDPTAATARRVLSDGLSGLAGVLAPLAIGELMPARDEVELAQRRVVAQCEQVRMCALDRIDQMQLGGGEVLDDELATGDERRDHLFLGRVPRGIQREPQT